MAKGIEFAVNDVTGRERIFNTFDKAAGFAVAIAASTGSKVYIDVLIYSRAAAARWGGDYAVEEWESDPEASVSDRIEVKANDIGRIA